MTYRHLPFILALLVACSYGASDAGHHKADEKKSESTASPDKMSEQMTVTISDANLRAVIADSLNKASDEAISAAEMAMLKQLVAPNAEIGDLAGLEHATNLTVLDLGDARVEDKRVNSNQISDLSHLAGLTKLRVLDLERNTSISDLSHLAGLTDLRTLRLSANTISDISHLAGLTKLRNLSLAANKNISDISHLAGLTKLRNLSLNLNKVSDISHLAGLMELRTLSLNNNKVSDISALSGLSNLKTLNLRRNPLSDASNNTHAQALQDRGVKVNLDN